MLKSGYLGKAREERGRLRGFLLIGFKRFMRDQWQREQAVKRGGGQMKLHIDGVMAEQRFNMEMESGLSLDQEFDRNWAREILAQASRQLSAKYAGEGRSKTFSLLREHLEQDGDASYAELARHLGCEAATARYHAFKFRKRFREAIRAVVAETVTQNEAFESELVYLQALLKAAA